VRVAASHRALAIVGGPHWCARDAGDINGRMPFAHSLGDHPGHGVEQLKGGQQKGDGQQASAG
jgi:hypothetical protein